MSLSSRFSICAYTIAAASISLAAVAYANDLPQIEASGTFTAKFLPASFRKSEDIIYGYRDELVTAACPQLADIDIQRKFDLDFDGEGSKPITIRGQIPPLMFLNSSWIHTLHEFNQLVKAKQKIVISYF